jgi:hypothetical protein
MAQTEHVLVWRIAGCQQPPDIVIDHAVAWRGLGVERRARTKCVDLPAVGAQTSTSTDAG